jgi:hypothetical protein
LVEEDVAVRVRRRSAGFRLPLTWYIFVISAGGITSTSTPTISLSPLFWLPPRLADVIALTLYECHWTFDLAYKLAHLFGALKVFGFMTALWVVGLIFIFPSIQYYISQIQIYLALKYI